MGQLKVEGTLIAGPPSSASGVFPGTVQTTPLLLKAGTAGKNYQRATGILERVLDSPASFIDLGEPGNTVTQATFVYIKSSAPLLLRLTFEDGANPDIVSQVPIDGPYIHEVDGARYLKLLEAQGAATVEYFLAGNS